MAKRLKQSVEGLVIIAIGLFLLINSVRISNNPIEYNGWTNVLAQAKFMPIVMSSGVTVLGFILFIKQYVGKDHCNGKLSKEEWIHLLVCVVLISAYSVCTYLFNFFYPTILFAFSIFAYLNWKTRKKWVIVLIALLAIVLGLYGMPLLINLRLPMM